MGLAVDPRPNAVVDDEGAGLLASRAEDGRCEEDDELPLYDMVRGVNGRSIWLPTRSEVEWESAGVGGMLFFSRERLKASSKPAGAAAVTPLAGPPLVAILLGVTPLRNNLSRSLSLSRAVAVSV